MYIRRAEDRGHARFSWLNSRHSFSFGHYYDPEHMGFSVLRVINDDRVAPGAGFDTHGHRDMEIISYVLEGSIEHQDSLGNRFIVRAGEIQRMTAGTGVAHSEFNHAKDKPLKFLQIWISPDQTGLTPGYEQKEILQTGPLTPLLTPTGESGTLRIHQDATIYRLVLSGEESHTLRAPSRSGYLHVLEGAADIAGTTLFQGDAIGVSNQDVTVLAAPEGMTALWFDLPEVQVP